jgi:hypothetical protein
MLEAIQKIPLFPVIILQLRHYSTLQNCRLKQAEKNLPACFSMELTPGQFCYYPQQLLMPTKSLKLVLRLLLLLIIITSPHLFAKKFWQSSKL